jgi:hypothetical protein
MSAAPVRLFKTFKLFKPFKVVWNADDLYI